MARRVTAAPPDLLTELQAPVFGEAAEDTCDPAAGARRQPPECRSRPVQARGASARQPTARARRPRPTPGAAVDAPVAKPAAAPPKPAAPTRTYADAASGRDAGGAARAAPRRRGAAGEGAQHFEALGLERKATAAEVKKAFVLSAGPASDTVRSFASGAARGEGKPVRARERGAQVLGDYARRRSYERS